VKHLVILILVVVAAWFAWKHFSGPPFAGAEVPESERVMNVASREFSSVTDLLDNDHWTIILFTGPNAPGGSELERKMEVAVRGRVKTVRLVIVDVGDLSSSLAQQLELKELPAAWLFDGVGKTSTDLEDIVKKLG
jgi:hypothetical protein